MAYTTLISPQILQEHLDKSHWIVFDCRFNLSAPEAGATAYRHGHVPNAHYLHLDRDLSSPVRSYSGRHPLPNFTELALKLGRLGVSNKTQIVAYDDAGGVFAARFWWLLRCLGHEQAAVLDGGIQRWLAAGFPLTTQLPKTRPNDLRPYLNNGLWLSARQVENGLARRELCLIDARARDRFLGESEPIDTVAGHVPKALNRPFQLNLADNGQFLPQPTLRQQFSELTGHMDPHRVAHMCGSGVTACHNLLAMEIAGLAGSKLYAGSWSEWIRDKNRAVAFGESV